MSKTNIIAKIKELFAEEKMAKDYTAATGEIIRCLGEGLAVGEKVVEIAAEKESPLPDGSYLLDNGKSIVVAAGEIKEINEVRSEGETNPVAMEEETVEVEMADEYKNEIDSKLTNGTEVKVKTKGDALSVGDEVLVKDASGEFVKAPEGKHELEGGLVIYTDADGFINELETKETDDTTEKDESLEEMKTMFEAIVSMKESINTLTETINEIKLENEKLKSNVEKFSKAPSAESITEKQTSLNKVNNKYERAKMLGSIK